MSSQEPASPASQREPAGNGGRQDTAPRWPFTTFHTHQIFNRHARWGPGYRIYFGRDGEALIILLGGGTKKAQEADINRAKRCWSDYRKRKTQEQ
jgi:hypothetical protein